MHGRGHSRSSTMHVHVLIYVSEEILCDKCEIGRRGGEITPKREGGGPAESRSVHNGRTRTDAVHAVGVCLVALNHHWPYVTIIVAVTKHANLRSDPPNHEERHRVFHDP